MPTYDYLCNKCGHRFEAFQKMSDAPLSDCPECKQQNALKRLISGGAGLVFKGKGFYATDYREPNCSSGSCTHPSTPPPCCSGGTCPSHG